MLSLTGAGSSTRPRDVTRPQPCCRSHTRPDLVPILLSIPLPSCSNSSMKSGLRLLPPSRNGCGNHVREAEGKRHALSPLPWMVLGRQDTLTQLGSITTEARFFLGNPLDHQRIKCEEPQGHTCTFASGPGVWRGALCLTRMTVLLLFGDL